jgi:serine/threonine protein kinase
MEESDIVGEGTSSICRRGTKISTNECVAIKVYKAKKPKPGQEAVLLKKFRRQIEVLQDLMAPIMPPEDATLWNTQLEQAGSRRLFMQLIDYSRDASGAPGPDPTDGVMYVITEMAQCSLKDYIRERRESGKKMSKETVRNIAKAIMLVTAGLHAKGLVHLDLKPENLMLFNGVLKLIDVDGCVKIGTKASITDSSLSFSPCYCAPEWASFLIEESDDPHIIVRPALDVWSIGMTIAELVVCDAVLKPTYASFLRHGRSHREASFLFMDWLSTIKRAPIPKAVEKMDTDLVNLLADHLLVTDHTKRKTLAQSLDHAFTQKAKLERSKSSPLTYAPGEEGMEGTLRRPDRKEAHDNVAIYKGFLWKLNHGGDLSKKDNWLKRDMWLAKNGSLCYHSMKEDKQLILIDGHHLGNGTITEISGAAVEHALKIDIEPDQDETEHHSIIFACETPENMQAWKTAFEQAKMLAVQTMKLGASVALELKEFRLNVKNRRLKVDKSQGEEYQPVFKSKLWKLKADTDKNKEENWFEREMWIAQNGSLVYFSVKEDKELIYYTPLDLASATIVELPSEGSCKPWGLHVVLPAKDGVEFTPSEFAAGSKELRTQWVRELKKAGQTSR